MRENLDRRVLGALRCTDAVTKRIVDTPLAVSSTSASLKRNQSGLFVIISVKGLEPLTGAFDLATLPAAEVRPDESVTIAGEVHDPTGAYLPRAFSVKLPRNAAGARPHGAGSIFTPIEVQLLPAPAARLMAAWAQVRLAVKRSTGAPFPNVLVRVLATADGSVLGRGMSDERGEALVAIPGLPLFQPGLTPDTLVTSETAVRVELIPPPTGDTVVDWTTLEAIPAGGNVIAAPPALKAGETLSLQFSFPP